MNTSNPFGTEHIARERQAEIEKQLRQAAQLRSAFPAPLKRRLAIGVTSLSIIAAIVAIIAVQVR